MQTNKSLSANMYVPSQNKDWTELHLSGLSDPIPKNLSARNKLHNSYKTYVNSNIAIVILPDFTYRHLPFLLWFKILKRVYTESKLLSLALQDSLSFGRMYDVTLLKTQHLLPFNLLNSGFPPNSAIHNQFKLCGKSFNTTHLLPLLH